MTVLRVARPDDPAARSLLDGLADDYARNYGEPTEGELASRVVEDFEDEAQALGYGVLRLQTGARSHAALTLYETAGYRRITPFGRYRTEPLAVAFEKRLDRAARVRRPVGTTTAASWTG